jgi:hypothetical protein
VTRPLSTRRDGPHSVASANGRRRRA